MLADKQELIYISPVRTLVVVWKTYQERCMIERGREGEKEIEKKRESECVCVCVWEGK